MATDSSDRLVVKLINCALSKNMEPFAWGEKYLFTADPNCRKYDWLCVYDELPRRYPGLRHGKLRVNCPRARTMLLTQEPVAVKYYNPVYTRQFGVLLTNRPRTAENHPGYCKGAGYMLWYTGRSYAEERARVLPPKTKLFSAVYSAKRMKHTQHANRFRFLKRLQQEIPGFDWYGKGVRPVKEKFELLDEYKYHLAFENHIGAGHWTEKLSDALVSGCLPFYAGDPTVGDILPKDCFIPIPADDPDRAIAIIRRAIADNEYEKRRAAIAEARELMLTRYNIFAQIVQAIESAHVDPADTKNAVLVSRHRARLHPVAALTDLYHHFCRFFQSL